MDAGAQTVIYPPSTLLLAGMRVHDTHSHTNHVTHQLSNGQLLLLQLLQDPPVDVLFIPSFQKGCTRTTRRRKDTMSAPAQKRTQKESRHPCHGGKKAESPQTFLHPHLKDHKGSVDSGALVQILPCLGQFRSQHAFQDQNGDRQRE